MLTEEQVRIIRKYLKSNKIMIKDFATSLGVAPNSLRRYLNYEAPPSLPVKRLIYQLTGINLEE